MTHRKILKHSLRLIRYPRTVLIIGIVLAAVSALLAARYLRVSTDENKLFSPKVPFFHQYLTFIHDFPENEAAFIVVQAKDPAHPPATAQWIAAANAITRHLRGLHNSIASVDDRVPLNELGSQSMLFAPWEQVKQVAAFSGKLAPLLGLWGSRPTFLTGLLGKSRMARFLHGAAAGAPDAQTAAFVTQLCQTWIATLRRPATGGTKIPMPDISTLAPPVAQTPAAFGYYYIHPADNPRHHILLIKVYPKFTFDSLAAVSAPLVKIHAAMKAAAKPFSALFRVGLTGRPVLSADEMRITTHDTNWAEIVAMIVVFLGLVVMLRSVRLAFFAAFSLSIAIAWTFGYATLAVGRLNLLSTIFVIALIGIGMDYLIQILIRYRREAKRYERSTAIWARVYRYVSPPVITACLGAAGAFFVATLTRFRGDAELGIIGGGGLLLCLVAGYTVLPALLVLFPPPLRRVHASARYSDNRPAPVAGWHYFIGPILWVGTLLALLPLGLRIGFNPNLLALQAPGLTSVELVHQMPSWYAVVLSHSLSALEPIRKTLNRNSLIAGTTIRSTSSLLDAQDKQRFLAQHAAAIAAVQWQAPHEIAAGQIAEIATAADALATHFSDSPSLAKSAAGRAAVRNLRTFSSLIRQGTTHEPATQKQIARRLSDWQLRFMDELHSLARTLSPGPLNIARLPASIRSHYVSANGTYALYITPRFDLWHQRALHNFVVALQGDKTHPGLVASNADLTGIAVQLFHSTRAIRRAFVSATIMALMLVIILVFLDLRNIGQTLATVSVLALGLPMLIGLMGVVGLQWNFANFFAMPILIGAGHEYGVFMMHRYRETLHNPRRVWRIWDVSERALLLCAFVTCSSFGFLALARDRGIASLGLIMAIGIGCIYLSAVFVLRPLLTWHLAHSGVYRKNMEGDQTEADE